MDSLIKNRVSESGIITLDLELYYPKEELVLFDIKNYLFHEIILKEKEFRAALEDLNWEPYRNKLVGIICSADAIIPMWAYMLIMVYLYPITIYTAVGNEEEIKKNLLLKNMHAINLENYKNTRIVIKGCGELAIAEYAYAEITKILLPVAKSIMYGEPCSTVPVFKKK